MLKEVFLFFTFSYQKSDVKNKGTFQVDEWK